MAFGYMLIQESRLSSSTPILFALFGTKFCALQKCRSTGLAYVECQKDVEYEFVGGDFFICYSLHDLA